MEVWQQIGVAITSVVMFLSGMLAGVLAAYNRFRDGRWRLPKDIDWVDETLKAEAEVRTLREALEEITRHIRYEQDEDGNWHAIYIDKPRAAAATERARALAPEPPKSA